ncbi:GNAT family N-acetyltransferase [Geomicrobium sp. JCM 19038]|uniref:GNAT family N-acetyltransferase n=1 Tax=Geomicrobium sp. JCM 19038 TaxID=1460635 RepID=UPI00045F3EC5|nr:GNAT family N-acetyltransferase [Geomicrobium sp. JCM 19038]GAK06769.1 ribosomal-protein-S5p-alanine acetyltransferase [Geomicrobium sp. JCM 19038]
MKQLETDRLRLKQLGPSHAEQVLQFYIQNKQFLEKWEAKKSEAFFTVATQVELLKQDQVHYLNGQAVKFWIYKKEEETKLIGCINFSNIIRSIMQSCFVGYKMDQNENGKGYLTEALRVAINAMFEEYNIHRIEAPIMPFNSASIRVVEKLGFEKEGLTKQMLKVNDRWEDHVRFSLLNPND